MFGSVPFGFLWWRQVETGASAIGTDLATGGHKAFAFSVEAAANCLAAYGLIVSAEPVVMVATAPDSASIDHKKRLRFFHTRRSAGIVLGCG